jgi:hypothetical protein
MKSCLVPLCKNNSIKNPDLKYPYVSKVENFRKNLYDRIREKVDPNFQDLSMQSGQNICELHYVSVLGDKNNNINNTISNISEGR